MRKFWLLMLHLCLLSSLLAISEVYSIESNIETENMDLNLDVEVAHGFINSSYGMDLWYVWVNTSGAHLLFLAMYSTVYPSPVNYFIGQHYFTGNGTEVFIGNRLLGFEIYEDLNGNFLLDVNYSNGFNEASDEARYFFLLNSSQAVNLIPPSKSTAGNITHYSWEIRYNLAQGILIEIDENPGSYVNDPETGELLPSFFKGLHSAILSSLSFSFDYWIENNTAYLKTGLEIAPFSETSTVAFNGQGLTMLYSTSVLTTKPYNITTQSFQKSNISNKGIATSEIDVDGEKAFKLVIGDHYTLQDEATLFSTIANIYSLDSLPGDLIYHAKSFTENTENLFKQYFQKTSPNIDSNASLNIRLSSIIYRVCFPIWGNRDLHYDPLYIAYISQPYFVDFKKPSTLLPQTLLLATFVSGLVILVIAVHRHLKIKRYKIASLALPK